MAEIEVRATAEFVERPQSVPNGWRKLGESVMSNFDQQVKPEVEAQLRQGGCYSNHTAWEFCGNVWLEQGEWHEQVFRFHQPVGTYSADTLQELMREVNNNHGWE